MFAAGVDAAVTLTAPQGTFGIVTIGLLGSPSTGPVTGGMVGIEDMPPAPALAPAFAPAFAIGADCIPELPAIGLGFDGGVDVPAAEGCIIDMLPAIGGVISGFGSSPAPALIVSGLVLDGAGLMFSSPSLQPQSPSTAAPHHAASLGLVIFGFPMRHTPVRNLRAQAVQITTRMLRTRSSWLRARS